MAKEIERKFLLKHGVDQATLYQMFEETAWQKTSLMRGYVSRTHDYSIITADRMSGPKAGHRFAMMQNKSGRGLVREEREVLFDDYLCGYQAAKACVPRIKKMRYDIQHGALNLEVDVFSGKFYGLIIVEVEFYDAEEETKFDASILPDWIGRDVTDDPRYTNHRLAFLTPEEFVALPKF